VQSGSVDGVQSLGCRGYVGSLLPFIADICVRLAAQRNGVASQALATDSHAACILPPDMHTHPTLCRRATSRRMMKTRMKTTDRASLLLFIDPAKYPVQIPPPLPLNL
jgi:hypothetical protein